MRQLEELVAGWDWAHDTFVTFTGQTVDPVTRRKPRWSHGPYTREAAERHAKRMRNFFRDEVRVVVRREKR